MANEILTKENAIQINAIDENSNIVIFSKNYTFEGKTYTEIDLSGLEDMTGAQICKVERRFETSGNFAALKEMNTTYALMLASEVTGLPIEFFKSLKAKDVIKIRNAVQKSFF